jgi:hypothetical protein
MALVDGRTDHAKAVVDAGTHAVRAHIPDGCGIAVIARAPIVPGGMRTDPRALVADASHVALVERLARDLAATLAAVAAPVDADIADRLGVAIIASGRVGHCGIGTKAGGGIADPGDMALVERRTGHADAAIAATADAIETDVIHGTGVPVVAE